MTFHCLPRGSLTPACGAETVAMRWSCLCRRTLLCFYIYNFYHFDYHFWYPRLPMYTKDRTNNVFYTHTRRLVALCPRHQLNEVSFDECLVWLPLSTCFGKHAKPFISGKCGREGLSNLTFHLEWFLFSPHCYFYPKPTFFIYKH